MKRFFLLICILFYLTPCWAGNLIDDGDFEEVGQGSWNLEYTNKYEYDFDCITNAQNGSQCLRLGVSGRSSNYQAGIAWQKVLAVPNQPFTVTAWVRIPQAIPDSEVYLEAIFKNAVGVEMGKTAGVKFVNETTSWSQVLCYTNNVPANSATVDVRLILISTHPVNTISGRVFFDNVYVEAAVDITSITNPGIISLYSTNQFILHSNFSNSDKFTLQILKNTTVVTSIPFKACSFNSNRYVVSNWNGLGSNSYFHGDGTYTLNWCYEGTSLTNSTFIIDTTPPYANFSIPLPDDDSTIYSGIIPLKGVTDATQIKVYINNTLNKTITVVNNSFSEIININSGENLIKILFKDPLGNDTYKQFTVTYSIIIPADHDEDVRIYCDNELDTYLDLYAHSILSPLQIEFTKLNNSEFSAIQMRDNIYNLSINNLLKLYKVTLIEEYEKDYVVLKKNALIYFNEAELSSSIVPYLFYYNNGQWIKTQIPYNANEKVFMLNNHNVLYKYYAVFKNISISENKLIEACPNPFTPTHFEYNMVNFITSFKADVKIEKIEIFNSAQVNVRTVFPPVLVWDGKDNQGVICSGGVYLYKISTNQGDHYGTVVLIK